jgi:haloalkane dehalogenase
MSELAEWPLREDAVRTPDHHFDGLPDFDHAPRYVAVDGLRMHYVEAGPTDAPVVLMLHGEPTWSYLYRKMIPVLAAAGFRAIAPDLIGFGRSDKLTAIGDYSYLKHVTWVRGLLDALALQDICLVGQDWGSLIGLRLVGEQPERFARVTIGNGALPTGEQPLPLAFNLWRAFAIHSPWFPIGRIVQTASLNRLTPAEVAAYDAPFPSNIYKAGTRAFPRLVPRDDTDPAIPANRAAWQALGAYDRPFLTWFGANDPILGKADRLLQTHIPGCAGQPHQRVRAHHFLQEDQGREWAEAIVAWHQA